MPWNYLFIIFCFFVPIITYLIRINKQLFDIKGKLLFNRFTTNYEFTEENSSNIQPVVIFYNDSNKKIFFSISDKTTYIIKSYAPDAGDSSKKVDWIKGFVLPKQKININLPPLDNIKFTEVKLPGKLSITLQYGERENDLKHKANFGIEFQLEKTPKGYHMSKIQLTEAEF